MKHLTIILILLFANIVLAIEAPDWVDPNRIEGYHLLNVRERWCQFDPFVIQFSLADPNNMGVLVCEYVDFPTGAVVDDPNGRVTFTPLEPGIYYFMAILSCKLNDPNACVWPAFRFECFVVQVLPSTEWDVDPDPFRGAEEEQPE